MTDTKLFSQIAALPDALKEEVSDFAEFLHQRANRGSRIPDKKIKERKFGCAKGLIEMSPDFDNPLEEFEEYM